VLTLAVLARSTQTSLARKMNGLGIKADVVFLSVRHFAPALSILRQSLTCFSSPREASLR
jgi:hypothetical protein